MKFLNYKNKRELGKDYTAPHEPLTEWRPYDLIRNAEWNDGYKPYKKGEKVVFNFSDKWSFGSGSVYNWINNAVYYKTWPDRNNVGVYFLRGGEKYCAGNSVKKGDFFVDGDYYYKIKSLKIDGKDVDGRSHHKFSFVISSYPMDLPVIIKQLNEQEGRQYCGAQKIGDFEIVISHADRNNYKWLSKKQFEEVNEQLGKIFSKASTECKFEI